MDTIETSIIKKRLEKLLKCSINSNQINVFIAEAKEMDMSPLQALEFLEDLDLSNEELNKRKRGK
jgi:hypothetical protein